MNLHEYQAKQIFREFNIPIPPGGVATTATRAADIAAQMGADKWVVKAQIHAGARSTGRFAGRGEEQGGVRIANTSDEVGKIAQDMLDRVLITPQTGPSGREVNYVYVEQFNSGVQRELFLAMLVDRQTGQLTLLASPSGGENIESAGVESIVRVPIDIYQGISNEQLEIFRTDLELNAEQMMALSRIAQAMYEIFTQRDASLVEINPLAVGASGDLLALDAVVTLDDNALFRHPEAEQLRDPNELEIGELEAIQHGLNYVKLNGNIGCLASGAGLSLATLDAIKLLGGEPANFLDVPPVAEVERVCQALRLILSDPSVDSVLVNVFGGGIMRCDTIADALIMIDREMPIRLPLIVRLAGTNANFAIRRLGDMGPKVIFADDLADAAEKAVVAARQKEKAVRRSWWNKVMGTDH